MPNCRYTLQPCATRVSPARIFGTDLLDRCVSPACLAASPIPELPVFGSRRSFRPIHVGAQGDHSRYGSWTGILASEFAEGWTDVRAGGGRIITALAEKLGVSA